MPPPPASGDLNRHPEQPGDLDLWPFDLRTGAECQCRMSAVARTTFLPFLCFCDISLSSYGQTCIRLTKWLYNLVLWPSRSPQMSVTLVVVLHPSAKVEVRRSPHRKIWCIFHLSINRFGHRDLWLFELCIGSRVTGFPPANLQLATPFRSRLRIRHMTDGRTDDDHQRLMLPPCGADA